MRVAVVGGGVSGAYTSSHLLRTGSEVHIDVYDKNVGFKGLEWWGGVAYGRPAPWHTVNVPAYAMYGVEGDSEHMVRWLARRRAAGEIDAKWGVTDNHIPRQMYREYVADCVKEAKAAGHHASTLGLCGGTEVLSVGDRGSGSGSRYSLRYRSEKGEGEAAYDAVVLCVGNFAPSNLRLRSGDGFYGSSGRGRYVQNPWSLFSDPAPVLSVPGRGATRSIVLLGSRLTAVDVLLCLKHSGYEGQLHVVSRQGWFPKENHAETLAPAYDALGRIVRPTLGVDGAVLVSKPMEALAAQYPQTSGERRPVFTDAQVDAFFAALISQCEEAEERADGVLWQSVLDSVRPFFDPLWYLLGTQQRTRFLQRWRGLFEVRRHRVSPGTFARLNESGAGSSARSTWQRVRSHAAGVVDMTSDADGGVAVLIRDTATGAEETVHADYVINCTGPQIDFRPSSASLESYPLLHTLVQSLACPDPTGIGFLVEPSTGRLLGPSGRDGTQPHSGIFVVGPPRRGTQWETIATREIRMQAAAIAEVLSKQTRARL